MELESPNLHTVSVKTKDFGSATARFGIRDIKARGKKFYLNGKEISLLGVNRHESHPEFGYATDRTVMYRDDDGQEALRRKIRQDSRRMSFEKVR